MTYSTGQDILFLQLGALQKAELSTSGESAFNGRVPGLALPSRLNSYLVLPPNPPIRHRH
jgi:hypothetical protein